MLAPLPLPACSALWLFSTDTCDSPVPLLTLHACSEFSEVFFFVKFLFHRKHAAVGYRKARVACVVTSNFVCEVNFRCLLAKFSL